jgi:spore germination cell wall hydrolase CwlJ-like protein
MKTILLWLCLCSVVYADDLAVKTIVYEARGDGYQSQVMVGKAIRERMRTRGQTVEQVVYDTSQFSCYRNGKPVQKHVPTQAEMGIAKKAWIDSETVDVLTNLYARHDTEAAKSWREMAKQEPKKWHTRVIYLGRYGSHDHFTEVRPQWEKHYK